jgi:hypothetical protein
VKDGLDPSLQRHNVWSDEQRAVLLSEKAKIAQGKGGWSQIAQLISGKSDHHCMEMVSHLLDYSITRHHVLLVLLVYCTCLL